MISIGKANCMKLSEGVTYSVTIVKKSIDMNK